MSDIATLASQMTEASAQFVANLTTEQRRKSPVNARASGLFGTALTGTVNKRGEAAGFNPQSTFYHPGLKAGAS